MWFTSLVSRGENLPPLYRALTDVGAVKVVKKEMAQGQKQSRFIAWTFMNDEQRRRFVNRLRYSVGSPGGSGSAGAAPGAGST